ncbi:MAG: hypothetical protein M1827_004111 [Pycnora praestabilis]|nr:MAG: hypothetical protein M1827_004111 [Pycnora praestabilis]
MSSTSGLLQQQRTSAPTSTKRLLHELAQYQEERNPALLFLGPVSDEQMLQWEAVMVGVGGSAYEGGLWKLDIRIPQNYPLAPPEIRFVTPICHPNVHFKLTTALVPKQTGEICLDLLKTTWSPAYTISSTLTSIHQLLTDPEADSPLNVDVAVLLRQGDVVGAEGLVRFWTGEERWEGQGR